MEYRRLGRAGIKVSVLSLGSWVTFGKQVQEADATALLKKAYDGGVNFFDNAETYEGGLSETLMGNALKNLGLRRSSYLVSSKFYWGLHDGVNEEYTLNRKYLLDAIDKSLKRFQLDYLDLVYCHRADKGTPIEETVWAMHDVISRGKALYWGTSEWAADEIRAAYDIAERHHLHKPIVEQPQYNLLHRDKVEKEFLRLYEDWKLGLTIWSPLASGILTGKYKDGIPADSRGAVPGYEWLKKSLEDQKTRSKVERLRPIAEGIGTTLAKFSIAWCAKNPNVSTVILGASKMNQLEENLSALELLPKLTAEVMLAADEALKDPE
ncbi:MAG: potassium channel beta subunit family protein [Fimbriimonadaceae bacterium]